MTPTTIKANDSNVTFTDTIKLNGLIVDLTGSSVSFECRPNNGGVTFSASASITGSQTSGLLIIGNTYIIVTFNAGDNFTNVGAASNTTGVIFTATGTTPTTWSNASVLSQSQVTYSPGQPLPTGFPTAVGGYVQEWRIVGPSGAGSKVFTFPQDGYNTLRIMEDLHE